MAVDTELGLQVQTVHQMECQGGITEYLRIITHTFLQVQDHCRIGHSLQTEIITFRQRSGAGRIIAVGIVYRQPGNHLDHCTPGILSAAIFRSITSPGMIDQQVHGCRKPRGRVGIVGDLCIQTFIIRIVYNTLLVGIIQESTHGRVLTCLLDIYLMVV